MSGRLYVGTSGFSYDHWRGVLYDAQSPPARWLERYAGCFDTVEMNVSFYRMPRPGDCRQWSQRAPQDFTFALKLNRELTHSLRLARCERELGEFLEAARALGERLGPILVQLPPSFPRDLGRLEGFLNACPGDLRWAVEVRHRSWLCGQLYALLRRRNVSLVLHDHLANMPLVRTADWLYMRYHGARQAGGCYPPQVLERAGRFLARQSSAGADAYVYFNNDWHGHAVRNAAALRSLLGLPSPWVERDAGVMPLFAS